MILRRFIVAKQPEDNSSHIHYTLFSHYIHLFPGEPLSVIVDSNLRREQTKVVRTQECVPKVRGFVHHPRNFFESKLVGAALSWRWMVGVSVEMAGIAARGLGEPTEKARCVSLEFSLKGPAAVLRH
jgi:hypothetical protein